MLRWFHRIGENFYLSGRVIPTMFGCLVYFALVILGLLGVAAVIYAVW